MTNEEKTTELYQSIPQYPYHIQYDETIENFTTNQLCGLLEQMAKWKDQQFKEYLEKKLSSVKSELSETYIWDESGKFIELRGQMIILEKIINERFKEE